jgi:hypothetical protein
LAGPHGLVHDNASILKIAAEFYKELFKKESRGDVSLNEDFWEKSDMVNEIEREALVASFTKSEIKEVVFGCYPEGSPGPDGLPFIFYQKFWDIVKPDIINMVKAFHAGKLDLFRINFANITLIPKTDNASDMKNYRPISLLNCSFKIFGKLLTNRLEGLCQRLIAREQSTFIRGDIFLKVLWLLMRWFIVFISKKTGIILKLDYEKAYNRVNIDFLLEILRLRGFGE